MTLPDGIHLDVPFSDYLAIDAVSNSGDLSRVRRSAAYYHAMKGKDTGGSSPAMRVGSLVNDFVLVPHLALSRFVVAGDCGATLKNGNECGNAGRVVVDGESYCGKHAPDSAPDDMILVTEEQVRRAQDMADAVLDDEDAAALLNRCGLREVTMLWTDRATGLRCKGRVDAIEDGTVNPFRLPAMLDLKKSMYAHPDRFPSEVMRRGYHQQLAFYDSGYHTITGLHTEPYIVAVNDQKGDDVHEVGTYQIIADAIEAGRDANRKALAFIKKCQDEGRYPGFGARPMSIPAWAMGDDEDDGDEPSEGGDSNG